MVTTLLCQVSAMLQPAANNLAAVHVHPWRKPWSVTVCDPVVCLLQILLSARLCSSNTQIIQIKFALERAGWRFAFNRGAERQSLLACISYYHSLFWHGLGENYHMDAILSCAVSWTYTREGVALCETSVILHNLFRVSIGSQTYSKS